MGTSPTGLAIKTAHCPTTGSLTTRSTCVLGRVQNTITLTIVLLICTQDSVSLSVQLIRTPSRTITPENVSPDAQGLTSMLIGPPVTVLPCVLQGCTQIQLLWHVSQTAPFTPKDTFTKPTEAAYKTVKTSVSIKTSLPEHALTPLDALLDTGDWTLQASALMSAQQLLICMVTLWLKLAYLPAKIKPLAPKTTTLTSPPENVS